MRRKSIFTLLVVLSIFAFSIQGNAASKGIVTGNGVNLRSGPGTGYGKVGSVSSGETYYLVSDQLFANEGGCSNGWYKISYGTTEGYICAKYLNVEIIAVSSDCKANMQAAGFPDSYIDKLCDLKTTHPNWTFKSINTGVDWNEAVNKESSCGNSFIESSASENIDTSCYNPYKSSWYPASKTAVAKYLDPRNWLTEKYMFQFEYLQYDSSVSGYYPTGAQSIIKNSDFYAVHQNLHNTINDAGRDSDVSPIFLANRMLQELGNGTSERNLYSGTYAGYEGYYNFFNYGVNDTCATTYGAAYCGLTYAKNNGWNSPYNAIKGAATKLANNYISIGQNTLYLQKYNVNPNNVSARYTHQYMTNVASPSSESVTTYNTYKKLGLIDLAFVFYIPVFNNMDNTVTNSSSGVVVDNSSSSSSSSSTSTEQPKTTIAAGTVATSAGYKVSGNNIYGINPGTSVGQLKGNLESISGSNAVTIKNNQGQAINDGNVATGYTVSISASDNQDFTIIIFGDVSGDGVINSLDLLKIQKHILGSAKLSGSQAQAASMDISSTNINALNLLKVQKHILGSAKIAQ
ncbi:MAG: SH3 domain-containing protein [Bacilli bacterium]|nr:SH3 domain-containing protein [Bacilli bacterium]